MKPSKCRIKSGSRLRSTNNAHGCLSIRHPAGQATGRETHGAREVGAIDGHAGAAAGTAAGGAAPSREGDVAGATAPRDGYGPVGVAYKSNLVATRLGDGVVAVSSGGHGAGTSGSGSARGCGGVATADFAAAGASAFAAG